MSDDYDVLDYSQCQGKLYMSNTRSAEYAYEPGKTAIHLEEFKGLAYDGFCNQLDKAEDICKAWVADGVLLDSGGFRPTATPLPRSTR